MIAEERCLIMFAKYPEAGKVKTRLAASWEGDRAACLYRAFIEDLLGRLSHGDYRFRLAYDPPERKHEFIKMFGADAVYVPQQGADLGERMEHAFKQGFDEGFLSIVLIGSDSPDLPPAIIEEAFQTLEIHQAVIGPACDGGYYLIGFNREAYYPQIFQDIPWGSENVREKTMLTLTAAGAYVYELPVWRDVDRPEDVDALVRDAEAHGFTESRTMAFLHGCDDLKRAG